MIKCDSSKFISCVYWLIGTMAETNMRIAVNIQIENLNKEYISSRKMKSHVLKDINIKFDKDEFIAVMGRSGSGKSTLLKILGGLEPATSGTVKFDGDNLCEMTKNQIDLHRSETIGFVFQDFGLIDALTILENIMLPLVMNKMDKQKAKMEAEKIMSHMEITHLNEKYPNEISGGEQQRVSICRALVKQPKLILADEPTGNLDYHSSTIILDLLSGINKKQKKPIILVTHDDYSASFCDRVIILHDGKNVTELARDGGQLDFENRIALEMRIHRKGL
jgi:ABC-type lipoprotein export system ATPase subunit